MSTRSAKSDEDEAAAAARSNLHDVDDDDGTGINREDSERMKQQQSHHGSSKCSDHQASSGHTRSLTDEEHIESAADDSTEREQEQPGAAAVHDTVENGSQTGVQSSENEHQVAPAPVHQTEIVETDSRVRDRARRIAQKRRYLEEYAAEEQRRQNTAFSSLHANDVSPGERRQNTASGVHSNEEVSSGGRRLNTASTLHANEASPRDDMAAASMPSGRPLGNGHLYVVRVTRKAAAANGVASLPQDRDEEVQLNKHDWEHAPNPDASASSKGVARAAHASEEEEEKTEEEEEEEEVQEETRPGAYPTPGRAMGQYPAWGRTSAPRRRLSPLQSIRALMGGARRNSSSGVEGSSSSGDGDGNTASVLEATPVTDATPIVFPDKVSSAGDLEREERMNQKRRRTKMFLIGFGLLAVGVVVGVFAAIGKSGGDGGGEPDICETPDPDYQLQCQCGSQISESTVTQVQENYGILPGLLNQTAPEDPLSCNVTNVALWWMANDTYYRNLTLDGATNTTASRLTERYILALLYLSTNGNQWKNSKNWLSQEDQCDWFGISCTYPILERFVFGLDLVQNNLTGTIPSEMALLTSIVLLDMNHNQINGTLPTRLFKEMSKIRRINFCDNMLSGTLPEIADVPKLVAEFLATNSNVTAEEIMRNTSLLDLNRQLYSIDFSNNMFTGVFPDSIGLLTTLRAIRADNNQLDDELRAEFATKFTELEAFTVRNNSLRGTIITSIGHLKDLAEFDISSNSFTGTLPSQLGELLDLEFFNVSGNPINGTVPAEMGNLAQLIILDLNNTDLTGTLPQGFCEDLAFLEIFRVDCGSSLRHNCTCCVPCL